jgi:hypothetical protein
VAHHISRTGLAPTTARSQPSPPGLIIGRIPRSHDTSGKPGRLGLTFGLGEQIAITPYHPDNHALVLTAPALLTTCLRTQRRSGTYDATVTEPPDLCTHLRSLEEQLLKPQLRRNPDLLSRYLADDFREFGSSGRIFRKTDILAELTAESPRTITMDHVHCSLLTQEIAQLTYRSTVTSYSQLPVHANRSSLWIHRDGRWQMIFHQGTRI